MQCHLVGILFYDSLTFVSLIFGGKAIHQKNPHQKSLILYIYTFQKLNPKYCLFAFEIGYFGHHASIKWKNFLKFLYKKFKIGGLWCCNKVLHNIVYQMPFTNFWYLNPEFCITMSPVCLLYVIVLCMPPFSNNFSLFPMQWFKHSNTSEPILMTKFEITNQSQEQNR